MRVFELVRFAIGGLWRQKIRSLLTIFGVAVGASSLAFSLSLAVGLRTVIATEFQSRPGFWEVHVRPGDYQPQGQVPPEKLAVPTTLATDRAERLRNLLLKREKALLPHREATPLLPKQLDAIRGLPDVAEVRTLRHYRGEVRLGNASEPVLFAATNCDRPDIRHLLVDGRLPQETAAREVLVPEWVLYRLGVTTEAGFQNILGQPILITLGGAVDERQRGFAQSIAGSLSGTLTLAQGAALLKFLQEVPQLIERSSLSEVEKLAVREVLQPKSKPGNSRTFPVSETFTVVGITRAVSDADKDAQNGAVASNWHLSQGAVLANAMGGEGLFRKLHEGLLDDGRYDHAMVNVRPGGDLPAVVKAIEAMSFRVDSSLRWYANAQREVTTIGVGLNVFSWVALVVAALGITNTLVTNVVERTREIGILKAIGATRQQILAIFLIEGTLIGTLGGVLGVVVARLTAIPLDDFVRGEIARQMQGHKLLSTHVFEFPAWLLVATFASAAVTTTLAAIYPAMRASAVQPIEALKAA